MFNYFNYFLFNKQSTKKCTISLYILRIVRNERGLQNFLVVSR